MRRFGLLVALTVAVGCVPVALAEAAPDPPTSCQFAHVLDPCQGELLIFNVGDSYITHNIPLDGGSAGEFEPTSVDFATVPRYDEKYSFITQGPFLRVIHHQLSLPWRAIDVEIQLDLSGIWLSKLEAAEPVVVGNETRYLLYVVGYRTTYTTEPWLLVFDQEALLADTLNLNDVLLGAGPICAEGEVCFGVGVDVAAGGPLPGGAVQEVFVSAMNIFDNDHHQRFYRLTLDGNFEFDVALDPWNDEGVPYAGSVQRSLGLDYDSSGTQPFGVFQTTGVATDLRDGSASCELAGDPTDIAVWGPGSGFENPLFHFVTANDPGADGRLYAFPADECPDGGSETLSLSVGELPRALALSSDTGESTWVYTANKLHGITAVNLQLSSDPTPGDRIEVVEELDIPFAGCPIAVSFRDEAYQTCDFFEDPIRPAVPGPPDGEDCPPGSTDPDCVEPEPDPEPSCEESVCELVDRKTRR